MEPQIPTGQQIITVTTPGPQKGKFEFQNFSKKAVGLALLAFLAIAIPVSVKLVYDRTNLRLQADTPENTVTLEPSLSDSVVNQDGESIDITHTSRWIGTGEDNKNSYSGFLFTGAIPESVEVVSARLKVAPIEDVWIRLGIQIYSVLDNNPKPFSDSNKPSDQILTQSFVSYQDDTKWLKDQYYEYDVTSPIAELFNSLSGQKTGIALVLKGAEQQWGRKFIHATGAFAPKLDISYRSKANPTSSAEGIIETTSEPQATSTSQPTEPPEGQGTETPSSVSKIIGDCNNDNKLDATDYTSLNLEIYDGDGENATEAKNGTYLGNINCDANRNSIIDTDDFVCLTHIIRTGNTNCTALSYSLPPQGDCNGDYKIDAGDFSALSLEINDGDGENAQNARSGSFLGLPMCDANYNNIINDEDFTCMYKKVFDSQTSCSELSATTSVAGDCNGDSKVDAGDLTAINLELNDSDGDSPLLVHNGSFKGFQGCDANNDGRVSSKDSSCISSLAFGGSCQ